MIKIDKRIVYLLLTLMLILSGCGASGDSKLDSKNNVQSVIEEQIAKEDAEKTAELTTEVTTEATTQSDADTLKALLEEKLSENSDDAASSTDASDENEALGKADPNVDIDLTVMNSNMVYSTVYQLMADAQSYVGQKIKIKGNYYSEWFDDTQKYYHFVIIQDATACCQQGMEFIWEDGSHVYPDEYPADMAEVEVVGIFETYKENPDDVYDYCRLKDATLVVCDSDNNE